jgi:hypothetical protein
MPKKKPAANKIVKYDFAELKKEYFLSPIRGVREFFMWKTGCHNAWIEKNTVGWNRDKLDWKMQIVEKTLAEIQDEEAKKNAETLIKILDELRRRSENPIGLEFDDLEKLWVIFMTMNGRVTKITKQMQPKEEEKDFNYSEDAKNRLSKYNSAPELPPGKKKNSD